MFGAVAWRSEDQINITNSRSKSSTSLTGTEESKLKNTKSKRLRFFFLLTLKQEIQTIEGFDVEKHFILVSSY